MVESDLGYLPLTIIPFENNTVGTSSGRGCLQHQQRLKGQDAQFAAEYFVQRLDSFSTV